MKTSPSVICDLCSWRFYAGPDLTDSKVIVELFMTRWIEHQQRVHPSEAEERIARYRALNQVPPE